MFLILAAVVVVCGHVYGGNSSDVYFDEPIFLNNITELGNKSYTLQPLTFAPSAALNSRQFGDTLSALLVDLPLQSMDHTWCGPVSDNLRGVLYNQWSEQKQAHYPWQCGYPPAVHLPLGVSLITPIATGSGNQYHGVFISDRGKGAKHAEDLFLDELRKHSFEAPSWFYISSTPCYKCTPKIIKYFPKLSQTTIFISSIFNPHDVKNLNAVMKLLVRGCKIRPLLVEDYEVYMDEISVSKEGLGMSKEYVEEVVEDAKKLISRVGNRRYEYTKKVLELLTEESLQYIDTNVESDENFDYIGKQLREKIFAAIRNHREPVVDCDK